MEVFPGQITDEHILAFIGVIVEVRRIYILQQIEYPLVLGKREELIIRIHKLGQIVLVGLPVFINLEYFLNQGIFEAGELVKHVLSYLWGHDLQKLPVMVAPVVNADMKRIKQREPLPEGHVEVRGEVLYLATIIEVQVVIITDGPVVIPFTQEDVHCQVS